MRVRLAARGGDEGVAVCAQGKRKVVRKRRKSKKSGGGKDEDEAFDERYPGTFSAW